MGSQRDSTATRHAEAALRDNITGQLAPFHPAACVGHDSEVAEQRCRWMGPTDSASTDLSPRICIPRPIISAGAGFDSLVGGARPTTSSSFHGARRCLEPMPSRCLSCRSSTLPHPPNPHHVHLIRCVWPLACAGRHHHHHRRAWPRRGPHRREMRFFCYLAIRRVRASDRQKVGMLACKFFRFARAPLQKGCAVTCVMVSRWCCVLLCVSPCSPADHPDWVSTSNACTLARTPSQ